MIAIIAILAAILFPVFARAREKARQSSCLSNVKQIGLGELMYAQDYDENFNLRQVCASGLTGCFVAGQFCGNALRFPTEAEALANARNLMGRWMLVTAYRASESDDEPNYRWVDGALVEIEVQPKEQPA